MGARTCALCAMPATLWCHQDECALCEACSSSVHSANALASRHKVVPISEMQQENADAQSEAHSAPFKAVEAPSSTTFSEAQLVPVVGSPSAGAAPSGPAPAWATDFDLFDLDSEWLTKLDAFSALDGFDLPEEDQLVPTLSNGTAFDSLLPPKQTQQQPQAVPQQPQRGLRSQPEAVDNDEAMMLPSFPYIADQKPLLPKQQQAQEQSPAVLSAPAVRTPTPPAVHARDDSRHSTATFQLPAAVVKVPADIAKANRAERLGIYRERKKTRKFQKTIRYASRKAYAEVRPRIKGRFATPAEVAEMKAAAERAKQAASVFVMDEDDIAVVPCF